MAADPDTDTVPEPVTAPAAPEAFEGERRSRPTPGGGLRPSRLFLVALLALTAAGLGLRLSVLVLRPVCPDTIAGPENRFTDECYFHNGDGFWYHNTANLIADGDWFKAYGPDFALVDTAQHPPLYVVYLAMWSKAGADSITAHRLASVLAGVATVPLVGLIGRRIRNDRTGLVAAGLAAAYPMLWINEGQMLSESIYAPLTAAVILAAYAFSDRPDVRSASVLGVLLGLAALTRPESLGLYLLVVIPLVLAHQHLGRRRQVELVALAAVLSGLVLAPWVGYNLTRFEERVLFSTGSGQSLRLTNCDATYYGKFLGYRDASCWDLRRYQGLGLDESQLESALRDEAQTYIGDNLDRLPVVMTVRMARLWDLYAPNWNRRANWLIDRRGRTASAAGQLLYVAMVPFAAAGLVDLRRRRIPISPLVGPAVLVTAGAALTFGLTRYRVAADVALCVAAAAGIEVALARWWPAQRSGAVVTTGSDP